MPEVDAVMLPKVSNTSTLVLAFIALVAVGVLVYLVLSNYSQKDAAAQH